MISKVFNPTEFIAPKIESKMHGYKIGLGRRIEIGSVIGQEYQGPAICDIFHLFVLGGSICHFVAVYFYVLPGH